MFGTRSGGPHARADVFFFFFFALDGRARVCTTGGMDGTHGWMDDVYRGALGRGHPWPWCLFCLCWDSWCVLYVWRVACLVCVYV